MAGPTGSTRTRIKARFDVLLAELGDELGPGKVFRPWRDQRFAQGTGPWVRSSR